MELNERMAKVETNIDNIKEDVQEIKTMLTSHVKWEENKYEELNKTYANKWVEKFAYIVIVAIVGAVFAWFKLGLG